VEILKDKKWVNFILVFGLFFKIYLTRISVFEDYSIINLFLKESWIVLLFLLMFLLAKNKKREMLIYIAANAILTIILLTIIVYYSYYGNVITYKALLQINQIGGIKLSIMDLLEPIAIFLFVDIFVVFLLKNKNSRLVNYNKLAVFGLLVLALTVSLYSNKVQDSEEIVNETMKAGEMGIFNYQIYSYVSDQIITANAITAMGNLPDNNITEDLETNERKMFGVAKDKNVVFIQLEAFQNFLVGLEIAGQEITPNLNKLVQESTYFPNFYQQIGTGTTSDAEFVTNTSIHPIGDVAMSYATKDYEVPSLPRILNEQNYETVTFHTNDVAFWDRDYLYDSLDFDRYYDELYFGREEYISFGASDEILYENTVPELVKLAEQDKNFYASVISMSSHHPYNLPEEYRKITLPEEYNGTKLGKYLYAVNYADYALGLFIEDLKANNLYDDTLFVVYGDHYALPIEDEKDEALFEQLAGRPYSHLVDKYNIPLVMHLPGDNEPKTVELVGGQVDIMPTVLNLMGIDPNQYHLYGTDLLNSDENVVPIRYYVPSGSFVNNEIFYVPGVGFEDGHAIDVNTGEEIEYFSQYEDDYNKVVEILKSSDAYVETLPLKDGIVIE